METSGLSERQWSSSRFFFFFCTFLFFMAVASWTSLIPSSIGRGRRNAVQLITIYRRMPSSIVFLFVNIWRQKKTIGNLERNFKLVKDTVSFCSFFNNEKWNHLFYLDNERRKLTKKPNKIKRLGWNWRSKKPLYNTDK